MEHAHRLQDALCCSRAGSAILANPDGKSEIGSPPGPWAALLAALLSTYWSSPMTGSGRVPALCSSSRQPREAAPSTDQQQLDRPPRPDQ
jgi:hypothetical protein